MDYDHSQNYDIIVAQLEAWGSRCSWHPYFNALQLLLPLSSSAAAEAVQHITSGCRAVQQWRAPPRSAAAAVAASLWWSSMRYVRTSRYVYVGIILSYCTSDVPSDIVGWQESRCPDWPTSRLATSRLAKNPDWPTSRCRFAQLIFSTCLWNPIHLDRIRQNSTYQYVPVCTGTYWYVRVHSFNASTYWYVQVRTWKKTFDYLIHPGSDLRVKLNSAHILCKKYDRMKSNFKKCKIHIWNREQHYRNRVFSTYWFVTGTYQYVPVRTQYKVVQEIYNSTDQYIPVRTEYVPIQCNVCWTPIGALIQYRSTTTYMSHTHNIVSYRHTA